MDYPFAMKYIWILAAVIVLVRIDVLLNFFERNIDQFESPSPEILPADTPKSEIIPIKDDLTLKPQTREIFLSLLSNFRSIPDEDVRLRAMTILKQNPNIFSEKLDEDLEAAVFRWRDLLTQRNQEVIFFLTDLMNVLKGENLEMVKRMFSLLINIDYAEFMKFYSKSKDSNCMIITYLGDRLPEAEKYNELMDRMDDITSYLKNDKLEPSYRKYAESCQMVLKLHLDELRKKILPSTPAEESTL